MKKAINLTKVIKAIENHWLDNWKMSELNDERHLNALAVYNSAKEPIEAEIKAAQGRASVRTLTVREIVDAVKRIETELRIPKKYLVGVKATVDVNAQTFPNAYEYTPMSTIFECEYRKSGWFVTNIRRGECRKQRFCLSLTPDAEREIIEQNYRRF